MTITLAVSLRSGWGSRTNISYLYIKYQYRVSRYCGRWATVTICKVGRNKKGRLTTFLQQHQSFIPSFYHLSLSYSKTERLNVVKFRIQVAVKYVAIQGLPCIVHC